MLSSPSQAAEKDMAQGSTFRIAAFNIGFGDTKKAGELAGLLQQKAYPQAGKISETIQRIRPDALLLNEIDGNDNGKALKAFLNNYLAVGQNGQAGIEYAHVYQPTCNTGVPFPEADKHPNAPDSYGFGHYPGQYCMALLSRFPIGQDQVQSFQYLPWRQLPGANQPVLDGKYYYSSDTWQQLRLSSKTHAVVPISVAGTEVKILITHPTPPVFDGEEDRNGLRNHDELRLLHYLISPKTQSWLIDDNGKPYHAMSKNSRFVIMGDLNASPVEGSAHLQGEQRAISQLLLDPLVYPNMIETAETPIIPASTGGKANAENSAFGAYHTADWRMRADYVIPSKFGFAISDLGVFWPSQDDPLNYLVTSNEPEPINTSDHRLVWMDLTLTNP